MKLILAQGNPGRRYQKTRHNTAWMVIEAYAKSQRAKWRQSDKFNANLAELVVDGEKLLLVKPLSFYNETGRIARRLVDYHKLTPSSDVLVLHDDLTLPFGTIRIRGKGSDAGNNGVKSLNTHLGENYYRIRIGIWNEKRDHMNDTDFVLGKFNRDEQKILEKEIFLQCSNLIDDFVSGNLATTSHTINKK